MTSGLDPLSEDRILELLRSIVESQGKTILCTIHNLGKLPEFDHITVLYEGRLVFQGNFSSLRRWFGIEDPLRLYHALDGREPGYWAERWEQEGASGAGSEAVSEDTAESSERVDAVPRPYVRVRSPNYSAYCTVVTACSYATRVTSGCSSH